MKKLHEIVSERSQLKKDLVILREGFERNEKLLMKKIDDLDRLQKLATSTSHGFDLEKIQLAESIMYIKGNPLGKMLNLWAVSILANNPGYFQSEYVGNKRYSGYYQESDHSYGMGPKHGNIVDEIGIRENVRGKSLSNGQRDACIYYLINIEKIRDVEKTV